MTRLWPAMAAAALAGVVGTLYLTYTHLAGAAVACFGGGGCEAVQASRFGFLQGVPLGYLGLGYYGTVLILVLLGWWMPNRRIPLLGLLLVLTPSGVLFSGYLVVVQRLVLDDFCSWRLVPAAAAAALFGLTRAQVLRCPLR